MKMGRTNKNTLWGYFIPETLCLVLVKQERGKVVNIFVAERELYTKALAARERKSCYIILNSLRSQ